MKRRHASPSNSSDGDDTVTVLVPPQLQVMSSQPLSIGPNQYARVPLTFAPRFPESDTNYRSNNNVSPQPSLYTTKTEILFETNRGVVQHHFQATALNQNDHGLPDHIVLGETYPLICRTPPRSLPNNCYDLHAKGEMNILQIMVSDPTKASVSFYTDEPRHALHWDESAPLHLPDDGQQYYLATVCTAKEPLSPDPTLEFPTDHFETRGLGMLHITTDTDAFFIDIFEASTDGFKLKPIHEQSLLSAYPPLVRVLFLSSPRVQATVIVTNEGSDTIRLMQAALIVDDVDGILGGEIQLLDFDDPILPGQGSEALWIEIRVLNDRLQELIEDEVRLEGRIRIQATNKNLTYHEWDDLGRLNELNEDELMLEIPLKIQFLQGDVSVGVAYSTHPYPPFFAFHQPGDMTRITGAFFPLNSFGMFSIDDGDHPSSTLPHYIEHQLSAHSDLGEDIGLLEATIVDAHRDKIGNSTSPCSRFQVLEIADPATDFLPNQVSEEDGVLIPLRYNFPSPSEQNQNEVHPVLCFLRLSTEPDTGYHYTPLVMYSGLVEISGAPLVKFDARGSRKGKLWSEAVVGFSPMVEWFRTAKAGLALRKVLEPSLSTSKPSERDPIVLGQYLYSLARNSIDLEKSILRPALLRVGAIEHGEVETLSLFLTNHNPVATVVSVDVGEVEGMSVHIGRDHSRTQGDGNSVLDHLPRNPLKTKLDKILFDSNPIVEHGPNKDHPLNGLREFLLHNHVVEPVFDQFSFRDAVSLCEVTETYLPFIADLYLNEAVIHFHASGRPSRLSNSSWSQCLSNSHPSEYGEFSDRFDSKRKRGPVIVSSDFDQYRCLDVCWEKEASPGAALSDGSEIEIPPGGMARFDIQIKAPGKQYLKKDITEFVATGLVLSTSHREVIPIIVTFEALLGKLDVTHIPIQREGPEKNFPSSDSSHIELSPRLFGEMTSIQESSILIPHKSKRNAPEIVTKNVSSIRDGVSIYIRSSFNREVILRSIESCNPLISVKLLDNETKRDVDPYMGLEVGSLESNIPCDSLDGTFGVEYRLYPSFYRCGLSWLLRHAELQPRGCGVVLQRGQSKTLAARGATEIAVAAFSSALNTTELSYLSGTGSPLNHGQYPPGRKPATFGGNGTIPKNIMEVFAVAWYAWLSISDLGLNAPSSNLRAVVEYNSSRIERSMLSFTTKSSTEETSFLTYSFHNLTVNTKLEFPRLFDLEAALLSGLVASVTEETQVPFLHVGPAHVADLVSVYVPVRNPTAVPVKVRLAVPEFPSERDRSGQNSMTDESRLLRRYLLDTRQPPYVQGVPSGPGNLRSQSSHLWWERDGGLYMGDSHGNVVRSSGNSIIKSERNTIVSVGKAPRSGGSVFLKRSCGHVCGIREGQNLKEKVEEDLGENFGHVGASSARKESYFVVSRKAGDRVWSPEQVVAGSSEMSTSDGPSPFSLPLSSLEETTLAPFSSGFLGPVFFRPPGKSPFLSYENAGSDKVFKSILLIQNSLTGIERLELRGEAIFDSIVFGVVDDVPGAGSIEIVDGEETFQFSTKSTSMGKSIIQSIEVQNSGDFDIEYTGIGLVKPSTWQNSRARVGKCVLGSFSLVDCTTPNAAESLFTIKAGESKLINIEYAVDCSGIDEKVKLRLFRKTIDSPFSKEFDQLSVSGPLLRKGQRRKCVQAQLSHVSRMTITWSFFECFILSMPIVILAFSFYVCSYSRRIIRLQRSTPGVPDATNYAMRWNASFRSLENLYPTMSELQGFGRDQIRHKFLSKYKTLNIAPPICIHQTGAFQKERPGSLLQRSNGQALSGAQANVKARMLSDVMFRDFTPPRSGKTKLRPSLNWQMAYNMGLLRQEFLNDSVIPSSASNYRMKADAYSIQESTYDSEDDDSQVGSSFHDSNTNGFESSLDQSDTPGESSSSQLDNRIPTSIDRENGDDEPTTYLKRERDRGETDFIPVQKVKPGLSKPKDSESLNSDMREDEEPRTENSQRKVSPLNGERKNSTQTDELISVSAKPSSTKNEPTQEENTGAIKQRFIAKEKKSLRPPGVKRTNEPPSSSGQQTRREKSSDKREETSRRNEKTALKTGVKKLKKPDRSIKRDPVPKELSSGPSTPFRAPPGLAPPPGFGSPSTTPLSPQESRSAKRPHPVGRALSNESSILSEALSFNTPDRLGNISGDSLSHILSQPSTPHDDTEFDVMEFLDGILNDGQTEDLTPPPLNESILNLGPSSRGVSSNPWASSRAAAYGIDMDDTGYEDGSFDNLPLLTPEAILGHDEDESKTSSLLGHLLNND